MKKKFLILLLIFSQILMGHTIKDKDISVIVGTVETPVYNVEVTWGSMEFTYNETINYVWDNNTHSYELSTSTYKWNTSNNIIDIQNKSAFPVNINLKYTSINENIDGNFDISETTIESNRNVKSKLILDGELSPSNNSYIKVGTINLKIS